MEKRRLKSKAAFARDNSVSRTTVTNLTTTTKKGRGRLVDALVGKLIDIDHSTVIEYLLMRSTPTTKKPLKQKAPKPTPKPAVKSKAKPKDKDAHYPTDSATEKVLGLTLRELVTLHGTDDQFKTWVTAVKITKDIEHKDMKLAEMKKTLIPRELVRVHIFGAIDSANLQLLTDTPKTLALRCHGAVKAGQSVEDIEALIRKHLSTQLKGTKEKAQRVLKNA